MEAKEESRMASQPQEHHKSALRALLDIVMLVAIPTIIIFIISKVWK
jgi:hypothetical protein